MAKDAVGKTAETPNKQRSGIKGSIFSILTILLVIAIIAAVFGGVFYFIVHNNFRGVADRYYLTIKDIPVLKYALPAKKDPLDPKNMTAEDIKKKYLEFRDLNAALSKQLDDLKGEIEKYKSSEAEAKKAAAESEQKLKDIDTREAALKDKESQLTEMKRQIDELVAKGDKESFKTYFESLDPENAKALYSEVISELQTDANVKKFAQVYAAMDSAAAAQIFEQMGASKLDMTAETLQAMNKDNSAKILESMTPQFAAKVTERLNALYKGN
ncbi:MAG TPA: hypothetical protein VHT96_14415 [Clostridia bacterium]|nr:hypothetical protein [Clostridia bacterium]